MLSNRNNVPLPLAVMLATDNYAHSSDPKLISATGLLRSVRSIILSKKVSDRKNDVSDFIPSAMGTALHENMEAAWKNPDEALRKLSYSEMAIKRIKENISFEVRTNKEISGYKISGQYDCVLDGVVHDLKSCSSWKWVFGDTEDFVKQLSIYKWLNPKIITEDIGKIMYWFTDWSAAQTRNPDYPQLRIQEKNVQLDLNIESFIVHKLDAIDSAESTNILPECNSKELWRKPDKWAYYAKTTNKSATKVFDNSSDAYHWLDVKGKGSITHRPGEIKACNYCPAIGICSQAEMLIESGELKYEII